MGGFGRRMARQFNAGDPRIWTDTDSTTSIIVTEIQRLERILDRLIDFTRRDDIRLQRVNPNDLIEYIIGITEGRVKEKSIQFKANLGSEIATYRWIQAVSSSLC